MSKYKRRWRFSIHVKWFQGWLSTESPITNMGFCEITFVCHASEPRQIIIKLLMLRLLVLPKQMYIEHSRALNYFSWNISISPPKGLNAHKCFFFFCVCVCTGIAPPLVIESHLSDFEAISILCISCHIILGGVIKSVRHKSSRNCF